MSKTSKVYFTDYRASGERPVLKKFREVIEAAGFGDIDFEGKIVAIKMHFGELGNMSYLRPNYARELAAMIREKGGRPFVTDTCTLYVGNRTDGLRYLETASQNGYNALTVGCPVIIADGIRGVDDVPVKVDLPYMETAHVAAALMEADIIFSLSHFKGHSMGGFGGTVKNLGMGAGTRGGKMHMHCSFKPYVFAPKCTSVENCTEMHKCVQLCPYDAIHIGENGRCEIDQDQCTGCNKCIGFCNHNGIASDCMRHPDSPKDLGSKMAEYAYATCHGRPEFHINLICDVSPMCDCCNFNDVPIVPNIGMLASKDPVAIDKASLDLVNAAPVMENSRLAEELHEHNHSQDDPDYDVFHILHPKAAYDYQIIHGVEIGLGSDQYELIEI